MNASHLVRLLSIDNTKLQEILDTHFRKQAADPLWVKQVADAIHDAHLRSSIASICLDGASDDDVSAQLHRVVDSSDALLEALTGISVHRQQKQIANRVWYSLHSFWTQLYGPQEDGDFWQRDPSRPSEYGPQEDGDFCQRDPSRSSELDQAFLHLRRLNQRSRRISLRFERANIAKQPARLGNKTDHYVDSLVMCLGRCKLLRGDTDRMTDRQTSFIAAYLKAAGRKHTTKVSVRSRWNRVKGKDTEVREDPGQDIQ